MKNRVVVTGLGVIAPNGHGIEAFETALKKGESGIRFIPELEELKFGCQVAGVPQKLDDICSRYFTEEQLLAMNSSIKYASISAIDAWQDAGLDVPEDDSEQVDWDTGAIIGTGVGGMDTIGEKIVPLTNAGKSRRLGSTAVEQVMASGVSAKIGGLLGLGNQVTSNSCACSTGTEAILDAMYRIRHGLAQRMLAGGAEGASPYIWSGFDAMRVLNRTRNHEPVKASRPMSASAAGFIPGAGSGILMIESLDSALERGAKIYAEVIGVGLSADAHHITAPHPEGKGAILSMKMAMKTAEINTDDVDYINMHGTSTPLGDIGETKAIKSLFGDHAYKMNVSSTKSMTGHLLGAAGAIEAIATILAVKNDVVPPTINFENPDPECDLNYTFNKPEKRTVDIGMSNAFGFGGHNTSVIFKKYAE
ncbi:MAG: beta-ketoacyl-[acyl-carrier-protein] synthase family protein [Bacteroidetes bacterium]|nr:beta-ketoacyl-[acyl-carrier-protein] synthase family protein [Bacteroidota bacterium]